MEDPNAFNVVAIGMGLIALALLAFVWWKKWF
jgi:Mg2+ and Co2+ transporter CorA